VLLALHAHFARSDEEEAAEEPDRSNVVDLMAALKRSLGQEAKTSKARSASKQASPSAKVPKTRVAAAATPRSGRKRA